MMPFDERGLLVDSWMSALCVAKGPKNDAVIMKVKHV